MNFSVVGQTDSNVANTHEANLDSSFGRFRTKPMRQLETAVWLQTIKDLQQYVRLGRGVVGLLRLYLPDINQASLIN
jgi:hypothetical protein